LTADQKRQIPEFLWHGPEAYGFRGQVWTCARVARVIEEEFGVRYHKDHVGRLLKELRWTPQQPIKRAIQRDEAAIERWRAEVWPELLRRARCERRVLVFEDESGFYLLPGVVRTYAPEGLTPIIREKQTRDHLSVMGGMTPRGKVYTLARQESLNGLHRVEFLMHLQRVAGNRLLVIWDGSPIHRRAAVKEFVSGTRGKIWVEALPGYAPDLNPWDEGGWHHLKNVELRNLVCLDLEELHQEFHLAVGRLRQKPHLVQSFFAQAGLKIDAA
jgi:transposase